jgi:hypothetical protein
VSTSWGESATDDGIAIEFVGTDADRSAAAEITNFKRALAAPPQQDGTSRPGLGFGRPIAPLDPLRGAATIIGVIVGALVIGLLGSVGRAQSEILPVGLMIGVFLPLGIALVLQALRARRVTVADERFTLTVDASGLSIAANGVRERAFSLAEIDHVEGGPRLTVVTTAGKHEVLRCALRRRADHVALSARLNEAIAQVRASAGGYRGPGLHLRVSVSGQLDDEPRAARVREIDEDAAAGALDDAAAHGESKSGA